MGEELIPIITVVLDIWSGRPNPVWQLSGMVAEEALRHLGAVPESATSADQPPPLGYRGLIVTFEDAVPHPRERRIYTSPVVAVGPGSWSRAGRALELWLLDTGRDVVDSVLLDQIRQERESD